MTRDEALEAVAVLGRCLDALAAAAPASAAAGRLGAPVRQAIGTLRAEAELRVRSGRLGGAMLYVFELVRLSGATALGMARVRQAMEAETPTGLPAVAVATAGIRMALVEEGKILALTTFVSRDDVDTAMDRMGAAFQDAEDYAGDEHDSATYRALISLHAAVTRDLSDRSRPLPRMVAYNLTRTLPSLALAQRLYADPSRADELVAENKVIHPAFCPRAGRALSR